MTHSLPLITTIATALSLALVMGFIAIRLKLPPLVGYLIAGVIIGPFTPGFVANAEIAAELAEIGVMLLMFGVGLHFSVDHLLETRKIALPGALLQITVATTLGTCLAIHWGWNLGGALIFGLALSVASTVVLIRSLESEDTLNSINGQIAVGWLVVEDLAMILVLVLLPLLAEWFSTGDHNKHLWLILGETLVKIAAFMMIMFFVGRKVFPKLLWYIARTGSRELFTLCIITAALSIAFATSKLFGMSFALGAFFSGMIIRESKFSRRAAEESLPFRDAFAVLFFVSMGMLVNPHVFIEQPLQIMIVAFIIVFGKSLAATALVLAFRYPLNTALTVSASLAQIGEFSFILAGLGVHLGLLTQEGQGLILAGALISITVNPFLFKAIKPIQHWIQTRHSIAPTDTAASKFPILTNKKYLSEQVVLVGYGQVGRRIERILTKQSIPYVVIEQKINLVKQLKKRKKIGVYGDASESYVLTKARIERADMLVLTTSDMFNIRKIINTAQQLNPKIEVIIRSKNRQDAMVLKQEIPGKFFFKEHELANGISRHILARFGITYFE